MRACRSVSCGSIPRSTKGRDRDHAKPARRCSDRTVELDSPNRVGLGLGWPLLDSRLAGVRVPVRPQWWLLLGGGRQVSVPVFPGGSARGGGGGGKCVCPPPPPSPPAP